MLTGTMQTGLEGLDSLIRRDTENCNDASKSENEKKLYRDHIDAYEEFNSVLKAELGDSDYILKFSVNVGWIGAFIGDKTHSFYELFPELYKELPESGKYYLGKTVCEDIYILYEHNKEKGLLNSLAYVKSKKNVKITQLT